MIENTKNKAWIGKTIIKRKNDFSFIFKF